MTKYTSFYFAAVAAAILAAASVDVFSVNAAPTPLSNSTNVFSKDDVPNVLDERINIDKSILGTRFQLKSAADDQNGQGSGIDSSWRISALGGHVGGENNIGYNREHKKISMGVKLDGKDAFGDTAAVNVGGDLSAENRTLRQSVRVGANAHTVLGAGFNATAEGDGNVGVNHGLQVGAHGKAGGEGFIGKLNGGAHGELGGQGNLTAKNGLQVGASGSKDLHVAWGGDRGNNNGDNLPLPGHPQDKTKNEPKFHLGFDNNLSVGAGIGPKGVDGAVAGGAHGDIKLDHIELNAGADGETDGRVGVGEKGLETGAHAAGKAHAGVNRVGLGVGGEVGADGHVGRGPAGGDVNGDHDVDVGRLKQTM